MRISDLSRGTGVPVATIKFYLREQLLQPGRPTARNQAEYGEAHLRRLRLIRAFTNIGGLDLSSVRLLIGAIEDDRLALPALYGVVNRTTLPEEGLDATTAESIRAERDEVNTLVKELGWHVDDDAPGRAWLALVLAALRSLGCHCGTDFFIPYAEAAERLAVRELSLLEPEEADAERAAAVIRMVLLEVAMSSMRRMALEHHVELRYGAAPRRKAS
ncbi:MerR family transcriptional regulator [Dactylosporangium sp. NPDC000555]|uniref:MerR family transcriptional regulator n=1 Tax=Dactylosporangium sp. NPDC000555 TaxID=3154260 RepID=UPI0033337F53